MRGVKSKRDEIRATTALALVAQPHNLARAPGWYLTVLASCSSSVGMGNRFEEFVELLIVEQVEGGSSRCPCFRPADRSVFAGERVLGAQGGAGYVGGATSRRGPPGPHPQSVPECADRSSAGPSPRRRSQAGQPRARATPQKPCDASAVKAITSKRLVTASMQRIRRPSNSTLWLPKALPSAKKLLT